MKHKNTLLILLSAALYAVPFLFSSSLWWAIVLFPIPLLYGAATAKTSFVQGFIWGLCACTVHGIGYVTVMTRMAHQWWQLGLVIGISIIVYYALAIGALF